MTRLSKLLLTLFWGRGTLCSLLSGCHMLSQLLYSLVHSVLKSCSVSSWSASYLHNRMCWWALGFLQVLHWAVASPDGGWSSQAPSYFPEAQAHLAFAVLSQLQVDYSKQHLTRLPVQNCWFVLFCSCFSVSLCTENSLWVVVGRVLVQCPCCRVQATCSLTLTKPR